MGILPQESAPVGEETVLDLALGHGGHGRGVGLPSDDHGADMHHSVDGETIARAKRILAGLAFREADYDRPARTLSGGWVMRAHLARLLVWEPDLLMLDEPTNHLDLATKEMLVGALKNFEGTMIFVSHDRMFLKGLGTRVLELGGETGKDKNPLVYLGSYEEYVRKLGHEAPGIYH